MFYKFFELNFNIIYFELQEKLDALKVYGSRRLNIFFPT